MSAEDVCTLFLAVVLSQVRARIRSVFHDEAARVLVNSAAPLDQLDEFGALGECFRRVVFYAHTMSASARSEWRLVDALKALSEARQVPVPTQEQSPTIIVPETHAAITGYVKLPQSQKGLYGVVDVGAGTTDVAFFWLQKEPIEQAWYYSAGTVRCAMDDIDRALLPVLKSVKGGLRAAREHLQARELAKHSALIGPVLRRMFLFHTEVLEAARKVHARPQDWVHRGVARYKLFLVGGGTCCQPVIERFRRAIAQHGWQDEPGACPIHSWKWMAA